MAQGTTREWESELPEQAGEVLPFGQPVAVDVDNRDHAQAVIAEAAMIVDRVGGVVSIGARRREFAPGLFETTHLVVKWDSYGGPAERLQAVEDEAEEPEEVAA
jgi:hypothetical protein